MLKSLFKILSDVVSFTLELIKSRHQRKQKHKDSVRPITNRLIIRLYELSKEIDELWRKQWEFSVSDYFATSIPDKFEHIVEYSEDISVKAGYAARMLLNELNNFNNTMNQQHKVSEELARDSIAEKPLSSDDYSFDFLIENHRYHLWQNHLYKIEDCIGKLATTLYDYVDGGDKIFLKKLIRRSRSERIADQAFYGFVESYERNGIKPSVFKRARWRWRFRRIIRNLLRQK